MQQGIITTDKQPYSYGFGDRLNMSKDMNERAIATILARLPGCRAVLPGNSRQDRMGIDFIAFLRGKREVYIDMKVRVLGCSRYWSNGVPEVALERWSVVPTQHNAGQVGWTLNDSKLTEYILFAFAPEDTTSMYLVPFQLLRAAFHRNVDTWATQYRVERQYTPDGGGYHSECIFVPYRVMAHAIYEVQAT